MPGVKVHHKNNKAKFASELFKFSYFIRPLLSAVPQLYYHSSLYFGTSFYFVCHPENHL